MIVASPSAAWPRERASSIPSPPGSASSCMWPTASATASPLNVLGDIYPKEYKQFRTTIERQGVNLPTGICKGSHRRSSTKASIAAASSTKSPPTNALG